jgi:hypothetical protein
VRCNNEPRKISPVIGRRSRSFWRARGVCSGIILETDTYSDKLVDVRPNVFASCAEDGQQSLGSGPLLQYLRRSAIECAKVGPWNMAPEVASARLDIEPMLARRTRLSGRVLCCPCLDWRERRPHLAGAIGAVLRAHSFHNGWTRQLHGARAVQITPRGARIFRQQFGAKIV